MIEVREILAGSTELAVPALLALRPHFVPAQLVEVIDVRLRPDGYRLVGARSTTSPIRLPRSLASASPTPWSAGSTSSSTRWRRSRPRGDAATPARWWTGSGRRRCASTAPSSTSTQPWVPIAKRPTASTCATIFGSRPTTSTASCEGLLRLPGRSVPLGEGLPPWLKKRGSRTRSRAPRWLTGATHLLGCIE
jgi:hypothetical protein